MSSHGHNSCSVARSVFVAVIFATQSLPTLSSALDPIDPRAPAGGGFAGGYHAGPDPYYRGPGYGGGYRAPPPPPMPYGNGGQYAQPQHAYGAPMPSSSYGTGYGAPPPPPSYSYGGAPAPSHEAVYGAGGRGNVGYRGREPAAQVLPPVSAGGPPPSHHGHHYYYAGPQ
jgi:hypothetical protein